MKWAKFLELKEKYPFIEECILSTSFASERDRQHNRKDCKEFVRTKIGFIAIRPFESLNLAEKGSWRSSPIAGEEHLKYAKMECFESTYFQISFHVEGEPDGSRGRFVYASSELSSIQDHIDEITKWFEGCEAFLGKQLIWEWIARREKSGSSHVTLSQMNVEIYLFPKFYRFKPERRKKWTLPPVDPALKAYLNNERMPPIMPGPIAAPIP